MDVVVIDRGDAFARLLFGRFGREERRLAVRFMIDFPGFRARRIIDVRDAIDIKEREAAIEEAMGRRSLVLVAGIGFRRGQGNRGNSLALAIGEEVLVEVRARLGVAAEVKIVRVEVAGAVIETRAVLDAQGAGIRVVREPGREVVEGDGIPDDVGDGDVLTAELEAVAVAIRGTDTFGGDAIIERDAIDDRDRPDRPGFPFRVEVPAIVDVVVGDAAVKDVADPGRELAGKPVAILAARVVVVVRGAVLDEVVARPRLDGIVLGAAAPELEACVLTIVHLEALADVMVAPDVDAVVPRPLDLDVAEGPVIGIEGDAAVRAIEGHAREIEKDLVFLAIVDRRGDDAAAAFVGHVEIIVIGLVTLVLGDEEGAQRLIGAAQKVKRVPWLARLDAVDEGKRICLGPIAGRSAVRGDVERPALGENRRGFGTLLFAGWRKIRGRFDDVT